MEKTQYSRIEGTSGGMPWTHDAARGLKLAVVPYGMGVWNREGNETGDRDEAVRGMRMTGIAEIKGSNHKEGGGGGGGKVKATPDFVLSILSVLRHGDCLIIKHFLVIHVGTTILSFCKRKSARKRQRVHEMILPNQLHLIDINN